jgi:radical SAM superfamily enzyme YgiQ (UPF0313 family)
MKKVLLINLPKYDVLAPPGALAILAAIAKENNYDYEFLDFNILLHHLLSDEEENQVSDWLTTVTRDYDDLNPTVRDKVINAWQTAINSIEPNDFEYIGISVFSIWSLRMVQLVLPWLRERTQAKIVLGGNGTSRSFLDTKKSFYNWITENNLADFVAYGDGEPTWEQILQGNTRIPGVNGEPVINDYDINTFPIPDYSGFDYTLYGGKKVYITGSRGCVRSCTFCDIATTWPKFRYRKAQSLVDEIKKNFYTLGVTNFDFTDSLINGSISNFYEFNSLLAEEKEKHPELKPIRYMGQFICRPAKNMPYSHYEAMHYAGCEQLTVGIESFSESVRTHMRKKFSNEDIDYHIEQSSYWNIRNVWLMITGYPTETLQDHQDNLNGLERYEKYVKQGILELIHWGHTMHLIEDTPVTSTDMMRDLDLQIYLDTKFQGFSDHYDWVSGANPNLTLLERIRRRVEIHEQSVKFGYPQPRVRLTLSTLLNLADQISTQPKRKVFKLNTV